MPGLSVPHHLPKFARVLVHCIGDGIQKFHPLIPSFPLPSIFPSIRDFSSESAAHIRWSKYWSFNFNISPSNEYSGLISLKTDWFDLLAPRDFQESSPVPQFEGISSSPSAFFMVQVSQLYITTGETIALTLWTFVGRVMSLVFNTLSRFVIAFLQRSKHLLISWLPSPFTVILEPKKRKSH